MTTPATIHLDHIAQIAITAQDFNRAKAFYQQTLGMQLLFEAGSMAFFQCGAIRLLVGLSEAGPTRNGTILYFKVDDIEAAHKTLQAQEVIFLDPPHLVARMPDHDLWIAIFKDSEDNTLALMSEKRR